MGVFPQLGIINPSVLETMKSRAGNVVDSSKLMSWIRISSAVGKGMVLESIPKSATFVDNYGGGDKSGRVGSDFDGNSIYADRSDRRHRPSPVISSLSVDNGTRGLTKKAKFSITCFTLPQAEKLSGYFLEPGYVVLVEYGWNLDSSLTEKKKLDKCEIAKFNSYSHILTKRERSGGTYDGMMGFITAGGYSNGDNETYIIEVELTTLGEIPSYLQIHKNGTSLETGQKDETSLKFDVGLIDNQSDNEDDVGLVLFKQFFNKLPSEKQTQKIKDLIYSGTKEGQDINGTPWIDKGNFINVDVEVRESITSAIESGKIKIDGEDSVKWPDGVKLLTDESFVRLELAFKILSMYSVNLEPIQTDECGKMSTYNYIINTNDCIVRAHKYMFSTDTSKLYVPNTLLPDFGLIQALTTEETIDGKALLDVSELPKGTVNGCMMENKDTYAFPSTQPLKGAPMKDTMIKSADGYTYGYLRNLYINIDFFIEVLQRSNYVAKDVYYEILNGISSAVNSYWEFEIYELPNNPQKTKNIQENGGQHEFELAVQDSSFLGKFNVRKDDNGELVVTDEVPKNPTGKDKNGTPKIPSFMTVGLDTPFLSSNLNMDIPGVMRNRTLGLRSSAKVDPQVEGVGADLTKMFAKESDPVMKILDGFKEVNTPKESLIDKTARLKEEHDLAIAEKTKKEKEVHKHNLELFMSRASVIPTEQYRKGAVDVAGGLVNWLTSVFSGTETTTANALFLVAGWNDATLLKEVEIKHTLEDKKDEKKPQPNPSILAIEFEFKIIGLSGLKVGDVFRVKDLPSQFVGGIFQIMQVNQSISGMMWETTVTAKMRNI